MGDNKQPQIASAPPAFDAPAKYRLLENTFSPTYRDSVKKDILENNRSSLDELLKIESGKKLLLILMYEILRDSQNDINDYQNIFSLPLAITELLSPENIADYVLELVAAQSNELNKLMILDSAVNPNNMLALHLGMVPDHYQKIVDMRISAKKSFYINALKTGNRNIEDDAIMLAGI